MTTIRPPAVAGLFYPDDARELTRTVQELLSEAPTPSIEPKALIAPHAGYVYSGPVAASAYVQLAAMRERVRRVVLLGPSHRVPFRGVAASSADHYETPLGRVPVDTQARDALMDLPGVVMLDEAHAMEHSLEVHLPFLLVTLSQFSLVPLVVGDAAPEEVAAVIEAVWGGPETLVVASSDLSHYLDYETACRVDRETTRAIEAHSQDLRPEQACGCRVINGLMRLAERRALPVVTLDVRNSGDTAGDRRRVVGYGAYALA